MLLALPVAMSAQTWDEITSGSLYLWGEGRGATVAEADQHALAQLISKISVHVSSEFDRDDTETLTNGQSETQQRLTYRVNTYSQATLTNTEQLLLSNEPDAVVGRYIKKSEVNRIFESRRLKVLDMVSVGQRAEREGKVDDALRHYYWAYTLLRSLPHSSEVEWEGHRLAVLLPQLMNAVFDDVRTQVVGRDGANVDLRFTFRGKPVASIDYTYFDGRVWSNIYSAKDGVGVLELPANAPENIQLKVEFEYRGEARIDRELESVISIEKSIPMRKSYQNIAVPVQSGTPATQWADAAALTSAMQGTDAAATDALSHQSIVAQSHIAEVGSDEQQRLQTIIDRVAEAIRTRNYAAARKYFTTDGAQIYDKLIHYGRARIVGSTKCVFMPYRQWVMARSVPMSFSFNGGLRKSFVEDVVFTFDHDTGLISNLSFGLGLAGEQDIMRRGKWTDLQRLQVIDFLENYKTAFALKRLDYLKGIFADDALIIVGRVLKKPAAGMADSRLQTYAGNKIVEYNKLSKKEYMRNLEASFRSNEFINIRFTTSDVRSTKSNDVFGIQIKQDYYSSNYGDTGYLFLMVDMRNPDEPLIRIRTWQPEKDKVEGVYGLEHF